MDCIEKRAFWEGVEAAMTFIVEADETFELPADESVAEYAVTQRLLRYYESLIGPLRDEALTTRAAQAG